jgi:sugar lactone lactonase YvrE
MRVALVFLALLVGCSSDSSSPPPNTPASFYVANKGSSTISAFTTADTGNATSALTISGTNTTLDQPEGIVVDPAGVVITTSANPARIVVFAAHALGDVAPVASIVGSNTRLSQPRGLALDQGGRLYVSNTAIDSILIFSNGATGNVGPVGVIGGSNSGLQAPEGIALDFRGRLYVASAFNNTVLVFGAGASGNVRPIDTIAGSNTGLDAPMGVTLDAGGRIYVANYGTGTGNNASVTVYDAGARGNATPIAAIKGANTLLDQPIGIALDAAGRIYVASSGTTSGQYRITVYAADANGNVAPVVTISGIHTGLSVPSQLAF